MDVFIDNLFLASEIMHLLFILMAFLVK